jgi:lincosamide nucleotidyltransferase A/C/D/E
MTIEDVEDFLRLMDGLGIRVWLDGGWAVDACLGSQTRSHEDLDIEIEERDLAAAVAALHERGYTPVSRDDTRPWNFVLGDDRGHEVDLHVVVLDAQGNGVYGPHERDDVFAASALNGSGTIGDRKVACISPEWLVRFHTGYDVDETDWADVSALCERFDIPIPDDYDRFL